MSKKKTIIVKSGEEVVIMECPHCGELVIHKCLKKNRKHKVKP